MTERIRLLIAVYYGSTTHLLRLLLFIIVIDSSINAQPQEGSPPCNRLSSCGNNDVNVSYPFRFTHDPQGCGKKAYELSCEKDRPVLYLGSGKYYDLAINYENHTIRLVDEGVQQGNCSSLPLHFLTPYNFTHLPSDYCLSDQYRSIDETYSCYDNSYTYPYGWAYALLYHYYHTLPQPVAVIAHIECERPVVEAREDHDQDEQDFAMINTASNYCIGRSSSEAIISINSSSNSSHTTNYVLFGNLGSPVMDIPDGCGIESTLATLMNTTSSSSSRWPASRTGRTMRNSSLLFSDFHRQLAYGFELSWIYSLCQGCTAWGKYCYVTDSYSNVSCMDGPPGCSVSCKMWWFFYYEYSDLLLSHPSSIQILSFPH